MPYDKEKRKAYNRAYFEALRGDPDYRKKEADRLFIAYWKDPEKKRQQNRESYYRTRGRQLPSQFKPYKFRDPATRPEPAYQFTPPPPPPPPSGPITPAITPDPIFNMRDLFS